MGRGFVRRRAVGLLSVAAAAALAGVLPAAAGTGGGGSFVGGLHTVATVASTIPADGDVNPYGVAIVPRSQGQSDDHPYRAQRHERVIASTVIANGISVRTDPAALVIGPTGVALNPSGTLFVADTVNSRIARIPDAVFRSHPVNAGAASATVSAGTPLNGPLGLTLAPNGDLLTVNAGDNNLVELTQGGKVLTVRNVDPGDPPGGALFGLAATASPRQVYFVNDDTNTLNVLRAP